MTEEPSLVLYSGWPTFRIPSSITGVCLAKALQGTFAESTSAFYITGKEANPNQRFALG